MDLAAYSTVLGRKSGTPDPSHGAGSLLASDIAYPSETRAYQLSGSLRAAGQNLARSAQKDATATAAR
jgi:hypothetical protein